jgi:hypothetical protein
MTFGKSTALVAGFLGAMALGVWAGPYITHHDAPSAAATSPAPTYETTQPSPAADHALTKKPATPKRAAAANKTTAASKTVATPSVSASDPELHRRLKPVLKTGANMAVASEGFRTAEQFATLAHASQNVNVPFMLLKHRVLDEGDTLVAAIRKSKPNVDAVEAAGRARAEARSDIASLQSMN